MSARAHKGNDSPSGPVPFLKHGFVSGDRPLQHVGSDRDFKFVGMRRPDENVVTSDIDLGRFLAKIAWSHLSNSLRSYTERFESEHPQASSVEGLNAKYAANRLPHPNPAQFGTVSSLFPCRGPLRRNQRPTLPSAA